MVCSEKVLHSWYMSDGRWVKDIRKAANKAGEVWVLIVKVLECMLRNSELSLWVWRESDKAKKLSIRNAG